MNKLDSPVDIVIPIAMASEAWALADAADLNPLDYAKVAELSGGFAEPREDIFFLGSDDQRVIMAVPKVPDFAMEGVPDDALSVATFAGKKIMGAVGKSPGRGVTEVLLSTFRNAQVVLNVGLIGTLKPDIIAPRDIMVVNEITSSDQWVPPYFPEQRDVRRRFSIEGGFDFLEAAGVKGLKQGNLVSGDSFVEDLENLNPHYLKWLLTQADGGDMELISMVDAMMGRLDAGRELRMLSVKLVTDSIINLGGGDAFVANMRDVIQQSEAFVGPTLSALKTGIDKGSLPNGMTPRHIESKGETGFQVYARPQQ